MYCKNCGSYNNEGSAFCMNCGTPLIVQEAQQQYQQVQQDVQQGYQQVQQDVQQGYQQVQQDVQQGYQQVQQDYQQAQQDPGYLYQQSQVYDMPEKKKISKKTIGIICAIAGAAILALLLILLLGGKGGQSSYQGVINEYFKAIKNLDLKKCSDLTYPPKILEGELSDWGMTKQEYDAQIQSELDDIKEYASLYKSMFSSLKHEIKEVRMFTAEELKELNEEYADDYGTPANYVQEAAYVTVDVSMSLLGEQQSDELDLTLIKVDGKWYVIEGMDIL